MLGVAAFHADKDRARAFWDDLTKDDADGAPDALADGAVRVDLDGRVEAALEKSVPRSTHPRHGRRDSTAPGRRWRRRHGLRPDPSRPGGQGVGLDELHLRRRCHGRQRTRHARRLHDRRHRRRVRRRRAARRRPGRPPASSARCSPSGGWRCRTPGSSPACSGRPVEQHARRGQHEPGRRPRPTAPIRWPRPSTSSPRRPARCSSSQPGTPVRPRRR